VHLYTVCWDEADMLGFFFRHYDPWVSRYVIYDDGSTDGSLDILRAHPRVELRTFARSEAESFVLSHRRLQNEAWKESRGQADWVVVTAIDEHLHVPGFAMTDYLAEEADRGVTLIPALGFDLNHPDMPGDTGLLTERVPRGRPRLAFNKLSLFKPEALRETGFGPGRHDATPRGDLCLPARDTLLLWHYKHLGFERNADREAAQAERLGRTDRALGLGQHYLWGRQRLRAFWDEMERESVDLREVVPGEVCIRPLWWEEQGVRRADPAPLARLVPAAPAAGPAVSVLVKSFQHARYIRQTIESVLAQSFQDFEIVATDDGSTDGTAEILKSFGDPRIRLECWPENRGISAAMNATVARARGRYLAILNSDDWALPGRLRRQVSFLETHPEVSLVFGVPRPVDEDGLPTEAFNDFAHPLGFADFSRRTWLRHFFLHGNILNAPSVMIRREAYADAGPYDPRLTNLQDFDMWIRMLVAGHRIHLLPDGFTAFRIRDNHANASAPSLENRLRSTFEHSRVLRQFADFDEDLFTEVFGTEEEGEPGECVALRLAGLARRSESVMHRNLALETLFERARTPHHLARLREWGGCIDAFNVRSVEERDARIADLHGALAERAGVLAEREEAFAGLEADVSRMRAEHREHRALQDAALATLRDDLAGLGLAEGRLRDEVRDLQAQLAAATDSLAWMRTRLTWRMTVPLRLLARRMQLIRRRLTDRA
jgi:glycosyltransferase involved in cell wall biosynthesis